MINMYRTILGDVGFRKGMDLYFERCDGKAARCEDLRDAMSAANGDKDLSTLFRWYDQAGTPNVKIKTTYNETDHTYTLHATQQTPPTDKQPEKIPVLIPLQMALLGKDGKEMPLKLRADPVTQVDQADPVTEIVLEFDTAEATYVFEDVPSKPVLSILRSFSAPVKLEIEGQTEEDLRFLVKNDSDGFNRCPY